MKYAKIENKTVVELLTLQGGFTLEESVHESIVPLFSPVPDDVTVNSRLNSKGVWTIAAIPDEPLDVFYPKLSRTSFRLLFTLDERVGILQKSKGDIKVLDWWETSTDPSLPDIDMALKSTQDGLQYLIEQGLLTEERKRDILTGVLV